MKHITECSCLGCDMTDQPCAEACRKTFKGYQDRLDKIIIDAFKEQNMPEKEGYPQGKTQSAVLVQSPMPKKKTSVARKGKRGK